MNDRIDPGPGWRLLKAGEVKPRGYEYKSFTLGWLEGTGVGMRMLANGLPCRVRVAPLATKAIATRATVICATPDGARTESVISRKSGLTEYDCERIGRAWENMQASPAKYIMLEIQREGEP